MPLMSREVAISLRSLRKEFKTAVRTVVAVDSVDLDVYNGEFITLLGPSGSGKTTVLRMIAGFELPTSGSIVLDGQDGVIRVLRGEGVDESGDREQEQHHCGDVGDPRGLTGALETGLAGVKRGQANLDNAARAFTYVSETVEKVLAKAPADFSWRELVSNKPLSDADKRSFIEIKPIIDYEALEPGKWLIHCHINHHTTNNNVETDGAGGLTMIINVTE